MKKVFQKWLPPFLMLAMALWFFGNLQAPRDRNFAYSEFARLPVLANGRVEPMDSLARNSLLQIREKQTLNLEPWKEWYQNPEMVPATEWLANVMMNPAVADNWPAFRVDNPDLISLLKLPERDPAKKSDGKHYSWNQIAVSLDDFEKEVDRVQKVEPGARTAYENAVAKMEERIRLYVSLKCAVQPANSEDWPMELDAFVKFIPDGIAAVQAEEAGQSFNQTNFDVLARYIQEFQFMSKTQPPMVLPSATAGQWRRMGDALLDLPRSQTPALDDRLSDYARMTGALHANQPDRFNAAVHDLHVKLAPSIPPMRIWPVSDLFGVTFAPVTPAEVFFNRMEPFYNAMVIYIFGGVLACFFWFNLSETLRRCAVWLIGLAFVIHTIGLFYRMALQDRPPVTNLYSSAIFIGWGACLLGIILEKFYRNGIGAVVSAGIGFITLIIAHHLALEGDTMEMMRAVLDTNFWLATHVVAVTTGYASTFVAGFLALIYIVRGMFTRTLDEATGKSLARMIYGIVCFATLFSFVGTVLGGIWADQSWGRFWGWDPKENGALIIVLWNALILHLRWGGIVRERGLVNCAVFGNVVTSWSWFGVNMLGIGLHSYGFTEAAFKWLVLFVVSQLAFIALGLLPARMWKSFSARPGQDTPVNLKPKPAH